MASSNDLRRLEAAENAVDLRDARAALAEAKALGTTTLDAVMRKYGLAHLLVEEEPRARRPPLARKPRLAPKSSGDSSRQRR